MNLNYNSFFVKRFLQCGEYDLPNTVCDLAKRVMIWTLIWSVLTLMAGAILFAYLSGLWAVTLVLFTDMTLGTLNERQNSGIVIFFTINSAILLLAGWFGGISAADFLSRKLSRKFNSNKVSKPIPAIEFAKGIWERIHDKTCRVIEYKNHPEDIRKAAYEAEYARVQSEIAKLKASQEYSRVDSEVTRIVSEIAASQVADNSIK